MDVTGNNIANVNTVGFKGCQTVFQDTLSQVIRAGGARRGPRGHKPPQVGLGVKVAATTTNWTQGATQSTGRSTDFMIEGDGFFVTRTARRRAAVHPRRVVRLRRRRQARHPDGSILQGWMADAAGTVNPNGPIGDLSVPYGQLVNPSATTGGAIDGNLPRTPRSATGSRPGSPCTMARASSRRCSQPHEDRGQHLGREVDHADGSTPADRRPA